MPPITAAAVQSLRARTGVPMLACKEALEEANGDEEKAIEILRKRGITQAAKKASRDQAEGLVFMAEKPGTVALLLLKCETDFVARADTFKKIGQELVTALLEKGEAAAKSLSEEKLPAAVQELGENISLGDCHLISAPVLGTYLHSNSKIAVVIGMEGGSAEGARDAAMHATAMSPLYISPEEVTETDLAKERDIWREQLVKEGKPEAMLEKIMGGKEKKFREESALLTQPFVKDPSKTVGQYLGEGKVKSYVRLSVG
ncbi:MAG: translation elongation factor Ts [Candidatus Peribacteraceae bacterium]|nr:translation elongation factor Ts [Candidatus Peribacteraceae bacterium]